VVLISRWFLPHRKSPLPCKNGVGSGTLVGRKKPHILALCTTIYGSPVGPFRLSISQQRRNHGTHCDEEIGLGLVEIYPDDLADGVCGIDHRPNVLVVLAELNHSFPRHQQSRVSRERVYDYDDPGTLFLFGKSYVFGRRLNLLEGSLKSPENLVERVRWSDFDRLQSNTRTSVYDKTYRPLDGVVGYVR